MLTLSLSLSMSSLTNAGHQYQQCVHLLVTYHRLGLSSPEARCPGQQKLTVKSFSSSLLVKEE